MTLGEAMISNPAMSETPKTFTQGLLDRTARARRATGMTQEQMGVALGIGENYPKYENRGPLPHCLIEQFCLITRVPIAWLLTDKEETFPLMPQELKQKSEKKPRRRQQPKPDILMHKTKK